MTSTYRLNEKGRSWSTPLVALVAATGLTGCGGLLDVTNPNNIAADDITLPVAATALVNGAQQRVSFGVNGALLVYSEATDELEWCGSRDGWLELDQGKISNGYNEFTDAYYPVLASARWLSDEAIKTLEAQQTAGTLITPANLARAYLWASVAYVTIADMFDDFVVGSHRDSAGAPLGEANMRGLYDGAIGYLNKALPLAGTASATNTLPAQIRMMRARAAFNKAIWDRVHNPKRAGGGIVASGADVTAAVADAQAALGIIPNANYRLQFTYGAGTGSSEFGGWIGSRQEMRIAPTYAARSGSNKWGATTLMDPVNSVIDPWVDAEQKAYAGASTYWPMTIVSAREMHLILAEAALAGVATGGTVQSHINDLRALNTGLTAWNGATPAPQAMLAYSRQSSLFLQGRRLADHYRFSQPSLEWLATSQAINTPGTFLPITARECLSNPNIGASKCST